MKISLIVPAYNEGVHLEKNVAKLVSVLAKLQLDYEIILCNDGSRDNTSHVIRKLVKQYPHMSFIDSRKNKGKGYIVSQAFLRSKGEWLAFIDGDLDIDPSSLNYLKRNLYSSYDMIIGSKHHKHSQVTSPLVRLLLSRIYSMMARFLLHLHISDFQCGFKCIRKDAFKRIFPYLRSRSWSWDTEMLLYAKAFGLNILEIPVICRLSKSNFRILRDGYKMGRDLFRLFFSFRSIKTIRHFNDQAHSYSTKRNKGLLRLLVTAETMNVIKLLNPKKGLSIIDFGCGSGYYGEVLSIYDVVYYGLDFSPAMIDVLHSKRMKGKVADIQTYNLKRKFDVVLISGALEFCTFQKKVIYNAFRHLNKQGYVVLIYPKRNIFGFFYKLYHIAHTTHVSLSTHSFSHYIVRQEDNNLLSRTYVLKYRK